MVHDGTLPSGVWLTDTYLGSLLLCLWLVLPLLTTNVGQPHARLLCSFLAPPLVPWVVLPWAVLLPWMALLPWVFLLPWVALLPWVFLLPWVVLLPWVALAPQLGPQPLSLQLIIIINDCD